MLKLKKRYVVNGQNEPVAVQLDLEAFQKIEHSSEGPAMYEPVSGS